MIKINLLNVRQRRRQIGILREFIIYGVLFSLFILGIFYHLIVTQNQKSHFRKEIVSIKERLAPLEKIAKKIEEFQKKKGLLEKRINIIEELKSNQEGPIRLLDEISLNIPSQVWLISLSEKGSSIEMKGFSLTNIGIATFMKNVESSGYFKNVELIQAKQTMVEKRKVKEFTIKMQMNTTH
ncbi:MAG TPA: PilN domain-containing protein [Nitrospinota bacterium]|nr:PilN domain-containing protein [Nitrospinota bacterium]